MPSGRATRWFALWLGVVIGVSGLTWVVVDRVGQGVGRVTNAPVYAATASPTGSGAGPGAVGAPGSSPSPGEALPSLGPAVTSDPSSSPDRSTVPGAVEATSAEPAESASEPPAGSVNPSAPVVASVTRTFASAGGVVTVTCTGVALRVDGITPRDGFRVENEREDDGLKVKFSSSTVEVTLEIGCGAGAPVQRT